MRWSAGVFVALVGLILVVGAGCRKIPTENNDRNRAPDTYLSAAPIDSISNGGLSRIPHRFRAQWAGSDIDGEVVGFFVAVTETTVDSRPAGFKLPPPAFPVPLHDSPRASSPSTCSRARHGP
jgi:hypothetical protein